MSNTKKTYRVIFRKNLGNGKRTRVVINAASLTDLSEAISTKAKENRMRPMRIQEMNGSTVAGKFRIKEVDGEYDIIKAKERKVAELTNTVDADAEKIEEVESNTKATSETNTEAVPAGEEGDIVFDVE